MIIIALWGADGDVVGANSFKIIADVYQLFPG